MKVTICAALMFLVLPVLATAAPAPPPDRTATSTDNAGAYAPKVGCAGETPLFGMLIGSGALANHRRRHAQRKGP